MCVLIAQICERIEGEGETYLSTPLSVFHSSKCRLVLCCVVVCRNLLRRVCCVSLDAKVTVSWSFSMSRVVCPLHQIALFPSSSPSSPHHPAFVLVSSCECSCQCDCVSEACPLPIDWDVHQVDLIHHTHTHTRLIVSPRCIPSPCLRFLDCLDRPSDIPLIKIESLVLLVIAICFKTAFPLSYCSCPSSCPFPIQFPKLSQFSTVCCSARPQSHSDHRLIPSNVSLDLFQQSKYKSSQSLRSLSPSYLRDIYS